MEDAGNLKIINMAEQTNTSEEEAYEKAEAEANAEANEDSEAESTP